MARTRATAPDGDGATPKPPRGDAGGYTVVARRYRPQRFEDVVGQDHVVQALRNAIKLDKVTHAYLFSGTRGVGKTSMARIFAKGLNCVRGPTDQPCNECDICRAIAVGQDVDVIEIDGASNNGVEAVRELRQNAGLRPGRARYKIYYIDEVHMLSTGAFNALLKTLEEPPGHVKFLFATTEPGKIPITVLSRCQQFHFAGIQPEQIVETLAEICANEEVEADRDALQAVARRAAGSMRDAQSLLEQLLSSGERRLTADRVHQLLGTAPDDRVLDLLDAMVGRDLARVLTLADSAIAAGVQPPDLLGGALEFLRDAMVLKVGSEVGMQAVGAASLGRLKAIVAGWSIDTILAAQQVLDEARRRLRGNPHGRIVVENALCRVARLDDLAELSDLVGRLAALEGGNGASPPPAPTVKKKLAPAEGPDARPATAPAPSPSTTRDGAARPPTLDAVREHWPRLIQAVGADIGTSLGLLQPLAIHAPNILAIEVRAGYNWVADACERPDKRARIEAALAGLLGRPLALRFDRAEPPTESTPAPSPRPAARADELVGDPFVQKLVEQFEARLVRVEVDDDKADGD